MCTSNRALCGADCAHCSFHDKCAGCLPTGERPFGEKCLVASCIEKGGNTYSRLTEQLISAFNALQIPDMAEVTELHPLPCFLSTCATRCRAEKQSSCGMTGRSALATSCTKRAVTAATDSRRMNIT